MEFCEITSCCSIFLKVNFVAYFEQQLTAFSQERRTKGRTSHRENAIFCKKGSTYRDVTNFKNPCGFLLCLAFSQNHCMQFLIPFDLIENTYNL